MQIYVTCAAVVNATGLAFGFNEVPQAVGELLIGQKNAYGFDHPQAFPAIYYCDPDATAPAPVPSPPPPAPPPPPPAPPPPAPAPQTLAIGAEDQHIRIDVDGDGKTDVHVIVDRPPQG